MYIRSIFLAMTIIIRCRANESVYILCILFLPPDGFSLLTSVYNHVPYIWNTSRYKNWRNYRYLGTTFSYSYIPTNHTCIPAYHGYLKKTRRWPRYTSSPAITIISINEFSFVSGLKKFDPRDGIATSTPRRRKGCIIRINNTTYYTMCIGDSFSNGLYQSSYQLAWYNIMSCVEYVCVDIGTYVLACI